MSTALPSRAVAAPVRLLLLRHGESTWNAERRWQGQADPPLSEVGLGQARAAAPALDGAAAIWSSDLRRARHTAELLAGPVRSVQVDARLRERHVGAWTGLTRDAIDARYPGWLEDGRRPDGWEHDDAVRHRGLPAVHAALAASAPGVVLVAVTHGGFIRAVANALDGEPWPIPNLGGVWLEGDGDRLALGRRVSLLDADGPGLDGGAGPAVE
jgi:probable phosphoglycerate mutase